MLPRTEGKTLYDALLKLIPGGVNSPVRSFPNLNLAPLIVERGQADLIFDVDGNSFIDYCGSWGSLILGHCHPKVISDVSCQLMKGSSFGITTRVEKEIASFVTNALPSLEKLRFVSSGTEATMSALRLARGYTSKPRILKFNGNYHGHSDSLLIRAGSGLAHLPEASSLGVPYDMIKNTHSLPYNDVDAARSFLQQNSDVAAVILEPIAGNIGTVPASSGFVHMLREETEKRGVVLIYDEVITGFRVGKMGAQGLHGITPDLTCLGKIIGGGFPAAAFGGRKEIMDLLAPLGGVYQAGTLSGNPVAMQAGLTTLLEIQKDPNFYEKLQEKTQLLTLPIKKAMERKGLNACLIEQGSMFSIFFGVKNPVCLEDLANLDHACFKKFFTYLFERGVYIPPSPYETWFVSSVHTKENLEKTRDLILEFINKSFP